MKTILTNAFQSEGFALNDTQLNQFADYFDMLIEWNQKINLTAIEEPVEVAYKHFVDSACLLRVVPDLKHKTMIDIGTGAGFPGIVLKIIYPNLKITLIDSLQKRVNYLNIIIKELELKDIEAIHFRGEDYKGKFDVVTSRAVANIEKLVNYTMHLLSKNGIFIAMKGNVEEELNDQVIEKLSKKYKIENIIKFKLPLENSDRSLVIMKNR